MPATAPAILMVVHRTDGRQAMSTIAPAAQDTAAQPQVGASTADEVAKLEALRDSSAIAPVEFDAATTKALAT